MRQHREAQEDTVLNIAANNTLDAAFASGKGFIVIETQGVISDLSFNYAYTIGRAEGNFPEIFLTVPEMKEEKTLRLIEYAVAHKPPEDLTEFLPFTIPGILDRHGAMRRFRWFKLDAVSLKGVKRDFMTALPYRYSDEYVEKIQVFQLLVSDKHNRLPGERRYQGDSHQLVMDLAEVE